MRWKNLKKWQRGALIGGAAGLLFSLILSTLILTVTYAPLRLWILWAYLFHSWPVYASVYDILPLPYAIALPTLTFSLTLLYAGLGSIWGLILQIKKVELRLFLIVIFAFVIVIYFLINLRVSLGILLY
jgi:hypothetical protein